MNKRGQVAVFVIVAIIIVVGGILVFVLYPDARTVFSGEVSPNTFLKTCVEPKIQEGIETLSAQGGYSEPEGFILHQGREVKYLCYTAQYYLPCVVQQPTIKAKFEQELSAMVEQKSDECLSELKDSYEARGYSVSAVSNTNSNVEIIPEKIKVIVNAPMTVTKESTQTFRDFEFEIPSKMYDLLMVSISIVDYESTLGDAETSLYTSYYPNLRIGKTKLGEGSTIYNVEDVTTQESFTFASRSLAWPGGYGLTA